MRELGPRGNLSLKDRPMLIFGVNLFGLNYASGSLPPDPVTVVAIFVEDFPLDPFVPAEYFLYCLPDARVFGP